MKYLTIKQIACEYEISELSVWKAIRACNVPTVWVSPKKIGVKAKGTCVEKETWERFVENSTYVEKLRAQEQERCKL